MKYISITMSSVEWALLGMEIAENENRIGLTHDKLLGHIKTSLMSIEDSTTLVSNQVKVFDANRE